MRLTDVEDRDSERVREMAIALPTSGTATLAADMQGGSSEVLGRMDGERIFVGVTGGQLATKTGRSTRRPSSRRMEP